MMAEVPWIAIGTLAATAATALYMRQGIRNQIISSQPTMFLQTELFDNGLVLRVTIRNRSSHPLKIVNLTVNSGFGSLRISPVASSFRGNEATSRQPVSSVEHRKDEVGTSFKTDMTLGSAGLGGDSGYRKFVVLKLKRSRVTRLTLTAMIDPSDGFSRPYSIRRTINFSKDDAKDIALVE